MCNKIMTTFDNFQFQSKYEHFLKSTLSLVPVRQFFMVVPDLSDQVYTVDEEAIYEFLPDIALVPIELPEDLFEEDPPVSTTRGRLHWPL